MIGVPHWLLFNAFVIGALIFDLWFFHRRPRVISVKEALWTSLGWISLAFFFNLWIYFHLGSEAALNFLTGYLLEESLSLDNLFIFLLIFSQFRVPADLKHHVLFYGILGAIVMRAGLIWGGIALVSHFQWVFYLFGVFLIFTGIKLLFTHKQKIRYEKNFIYKLVSSCLNMTPHYHGKSFIIKQSGQWMGTPLLIVLVLIESTDLIFALDSVPAILAITTDPFIVYTSNIFAILGLRSLFFALEGAMGRFYLFHYALSLMLVFIGVKMTLMSVYHMSTTVTLSVLVSLIAGSLIGSLLFPQTTPIKKS